MAKRYILEPLNRRGEQHLSELVHDEANIKLVDSYEPLQKLSDDVEKIGAALRAFQRSGISWEVFSYYLKGKGHSISTINGVMGDVNEFFKKLGFLE